MAVDSRSKRASSVGLMLASLLAPVTPDGTIAAADRQHAAQTYSGIAAVDATPPDDADVSVSTVTDHLGFQIRPMHVIISHAFDSARNADIGNPDRPDLDRYRALSQRAGRLANAGNILVIHLESGRAGERSALRGVRVDLKPTGGESRITTYTTGATDAKGYENRYPALEASLAMDSAKNADFAQVGVTDRDRNRVRLSMPQTGRSGDVVGILIETDGRAGNMAALGGVRVRVDDAGKRDAQIRARAT